MIIPFSKYHGCGNDFIFVDSKDIQNIDLNDLIIQICDRHSGIGADGFIYANQDPLEMIYYNQDGSRAPMCGNGIRCFAKYCYDHQIETKAQYPVHTLAGTKIINRINEDPFYVQIDMGQADFDHKLCGIQHDIWNMPYICKDGTSLSLYTAFVSTIHTVVVIDSIENPTIETWGKEICHSDLFQYQTNVNFVEIIDSKHIKVKTYERGCGMTLACGTGCCASVYFLYKEGKLENEVEVELEKGTLNILIQDEKIYMSGSARRIAKGEYYYETH